MMSKHYSHLPRKQQTQSSSCPVTVHRFPRMTTRLGQFFAIHLWASSSTLSADRAAIRALHGISQIYIYLDGARNTYTLSLGNSLFGAPVVL